MRLNELRHILQQFRKCPPTHDFTIIFATNCNDPEPSNSGPQKCPQRPTAITIHIATYTMMVRPSRYSYTYPISSNSPRPKFPRLEWPWQHADHGYSRQRYVAILYGSSYSLYNERSYSTAEKYDISIEI